MEAFSNLEGSAGGAAFRPGFGEGGGGRPSCGVVARLEGRLAAASQPGSPPSASFATHWGQPLEWTAGEYGQGEEKTRGSYKVDGLSLHQLKAFEECSVR